MTHSYVSVILRVVYHQERQGKRKRWKKEEKGRKKEKSENYEKLKGI